MVYESEQKQKTMNKIKSNEIGEIKMVMYRKRGKARASISAARAQEAGSLHRS